MEGRTEPLKRMFGPYECTRLIGTSGSSAVYQAQHSRTGKAVALRVMEVNPGKDDSEDNMRRCLSELGAVARLNNPYLVPIEDFGSEETRLYIAMRPFNGGSLADRIEFRKGTANPLPSLGETAVLLERMAQALDDIHSRDVVHGQVAPHNILFDEKGNGFLADLGLTKLFKLVFSLQSTSSFTTGHYSSPEQWSGERATPASDQYSMACVVYHLITGHVPFQAPSIFHLMNMHLNDIPELPHRLREGVPGGISMIMIRAMAKAPTSRYKNVMDFYIEFMEEVRNHLGEPTDFFTFKLPV